MDRLWLALAGPLKRQGRFILPEGNVDSLPRADGVHRFDMSIFRRMPTTGRVYTLLWVEEYNVFDTVTCSAPTTMASRSLYIGAWIYFCV